MANLTVITPDTITLYITTTASSFRSESRFNKSITIADLKMKLELISGCHAGSMKLSLYTGDDKFVSALADDSAILGSLQIDSGMRIHVSDPTVQQGEFEDVSRVTKYELTEEEYAKRTDSVRAFKERNKLGRYKELTDDEKAERDTEMARQSAEEVEAYDRLSVGARCNVQVPGQPSRLGCIRYLGMTHFKDGFWVGVKYDEPVGKNDGSVGGQRYFECNQKYGGFVKALTVTAGDFPPEDLGFEDDEEM